MTAELTAISSMATRQVLTDLAERFAAEEGCRVRVRSMGGVDAARMVRVGEPVDLVILAQGPMALLEADGHIVPGTSAELARSGIAAAVPIGAPEPSIVDEDAVRRALIAARSVCYSTGPSGDHLRRLWTGWGLAAAMQKKAVQTSPGVSVASVLAKNEADLGFQQLSELIGAPGIKVLGMLPPEIQSITAFVAAVARTCQQHEVARAFLRFATAPDTHTLKARHGLVSA